MTIIEKLNRLTSDVGGVKNHRGKYNRFMKGGWLITQETLLISFGLFIQAMPFIFDMVNLDIKNVEEFGAVIYPTVTWLIFVVPTGIYISKAIKRLFSGDKSSFFLGRELHIIQGEIEEKFGSVDKAISIYKELMDIHLELTDENFYKLLNESDISTTKRKNVQETIKNRISNIDDRIDHFKSKILDLEKKKDEIMDKGKNNENKIFNKINTKILEIEDKKVEDISIPYSEMKEKEVS